MPTIATNRKARFDYEILETLEVGLVLDGWEVKSLKTRKASLAGSHALVRGSELFLVGLDIEPYQPGNMPTGAERGRTIKLLASRKEIYHLSGKAEESRTTLVPLQLYTKGGTIKLELGIARGKKKYDKRESIKRRDEERMMRREAKRGI